MKPLFGGEKGQKWENKGGGKKGGGGIRVKLIAYASRIPPRPHEALRLGGFEEGRGRCLEKSRILYHCNVAILQC